MHMKTRLIYLSLLLLVVISASSQTYNQLWKKVDQLEADDLPLSALDETKRIYNKAKVERHIPQMMKAYLTMMTYRGRISPDSITMDLKRLEEWPDLDIQNRAVLYSILGGEYISRDFEKGNRYLHLSLKDSLALVDYPANRLAPMICSEKTSQLYMNDNLFDLLARRAILYWKQNQWNVQRDSILQDIQQTYESLLGIYKRKGMRSAWLLTALDAYPFDVKQQQKWIVEYGDLDVCAEVYLNLSGRLYQDMEASERLELLREGIKRYPRYYRINALKAMEKRMTLPRLSLSMTDVFPDAPLQMKVDYRNIKGVTLRMYRLNLTADSEWLTKVSPKNVTKYGTLIRKEHVVLPKYPDCQRAEEIITLDNPGTGIYYIVAVPDGYKNKVRGALVHVSGLRLLLQKGPDNQVEIVVLNNRSGHPVPGAHVGLYEEKGDGYICKEKYVANEIGVVSLSNWKKGNVCCQAQIEGDTSMPIRYVFLHTNPEAKVSKSKEHVTIYTDRGLYRPGQKIYYGGIVYSQLKDSVRAKEGSSHVVTLWDVDRREIAKQEVKTDAFGTFQGTFDLPLTGKMGTYRIETKYGSTSIRVEEYKRPTFEVSFDTIRTTYQAGDSVRLTGIARSFSGVPMQKAKVKYRIAKKENRFWWRNGNELSRTEGETVTDDQGRFEIPVYLQVEIDMVDTNEVRSWYYDYEVSADVTNLSGETQQGSIILPLGSSSLSVRIAGWMESEVLTKEEPKPLMFNVTNLKNVPVAIEVVYQVYREKEGDKGKIVLGDCVLQGKVMSNQEWIPEDLYALPSGNYRIKAMTKDESGKECDHAIRFMLFSLNDKRVAALDKIWFYRGGTDLEKDNEVAICFGTKEKDVYLFYDVYADNKRIESKRLQFSDSLLVFRYAYREEYGDGLNINFAYLKNGVLETRNAVLRKPKPQKSLKLKWKTFRDKLRPGEKEQWTLCVLHPSGKPADAQLMATLYDASLDRLDSFDWRFNIDFVRNIPSVTYASSMKWSSMWNFSYWPSSSYTTTPLKYSRLFKPLEEPIAVTGYGGAREESLKFTARLAENTVAQAADLAMIVLEEEATLMEETGVDLRTNFAETAFFYPQLRADASGEVNIEFTLPESLTEWKFMGLAHTKNMDYGILADKVVVSKEFMLQPNLPRFVRIGDWVDLVASLMNLSDKEIKGTVRMELLVPETEKVVLSQKCPFRIQAGKSERVSFNFKVSDKYEGLVVRMIADGGTFSDGEQRYLPILSNKQKLTESVLLHVNGEGSYTFSLESLFNHHSKTVTRPKMTVEFAGNPLWYAVQALKVLENPENDNVISWATAYYANSLMDYLAKAEPRIADSLQVGGVDLKLAEAVMKLRDLQDEKGAWSWYKGMPGSRLMTTYVAELLARLQWMTNVAMNGEVKWMYQRAMEFLRQEVNEEVRYMKKAEKNGTGELFPSENALRYLYIRTLDRMLKPSSDEEKYLIRKMEKSNKNYTIYGKAIGAIVLQHTGKAEQADKFLQSLMEYSVMTEEMGRYFDTPKANYSWFSYKIPTEVAAIEAIQLLKNDEETVEQMKRWLLKQKQAQAWDTPIETADAVYVLLNTGKDWLKNTGITHIKIGENRICTPENEALGYVKEKVAGKVMNIKKVTVEKKSPGIGWGAVYAEFEENMDQVNAQGNALVVSRSLLRDGVSVSKGDLLQVGEKLTVVIRVTSDRDMDFVQIKDERAACLEPVDALSGYRWNHQIGYYQEIKDSSTSFYLNQMRKGNHVLTYDVYVTTSGRYTQGVVTTESMYAPEFRAHGIGGSLSVK